MWTTLSMRHIQIYLSMRRLDSFESKGRYNSLWHWEQTVNPLRVYRNYILMSLARISPTLSFRNMLYRAMGITVGKHVSVAFGVTMDVFFPELIKIGDNSIIGYGTTVIAHEYLKDEYRTGIISIGSDVVIGANCTILAGVSIADECIVAAHSLVNCDVEGFVGGVPAQPIGKRGEDG